MEEDQYINVIVEVSPTCSITRTYPDNDYIWTLPSDKRDRKVISETIRDLTSHADQLVKKRITIRG